MPTYSKCLSNRLPPSTPMSTRKTHRYNLILADFEFKAQIWSTKLKIETIKGVSLKKYSEGANSGEI